MLGIKECLLTTPRSLIRRTIGRRLHMAMRRQQDRYSICEWGCGRCSNSLFYNLIQLYTFLQSSCTVSTKPYHILSFLLPFHLHSLTLSLPHCPVICMPCMPIIIYPNPKPPLLMIIWPTMAPKDVVHHPNCPVIYYAHYQPPYPLSLLLKMTYCCS